MRLDARLFELMERNKEARRTTMAPTNGLSRRRQRSSSLRDTPEDEGQVEFPEAVRLRERGNKTERERERDRDFLNRKRRRGGEGFVQSGNEVGEEISEESLEDDEEYEEDDKAAWGIPPIAASSSSTSSQNNRKVFPPAGVAATTTEKVGRQNPAWKVTEEMIGVPVPRKARSASTKRSHHEYSISGGGGAAAVEEQNHRQLSTSPARRSIGGVSPSACGPAHKKMKPTGTKSRPPKFSKSSSSAQDEMDELEVAEVLFGLRKQSQGSKSQETNSRISQKLDSKDVNGVIHDSSTTAILTQKSLQSSALPYSSSPSSKPVLGVAQKRKKLQAEGLSNSSQDVAVKVDIDQPAKVEFSSPKLEKIPGLGDEAKQGSTLGVSQAASMSLEAQEEAIKAEELKPLTKESGGSQDEILINEMPVLPKVSSTKLDVDLEDSTEKKRFPTVSEVENSQEDKFKIDLMAPPPLALSPERDGMTGLVPDPKQLEQDVEMVNMKKEMVMKVEEKIEKAMKKEAVGDRIVEKKTEIMGEKFEHLRLDFDKGHEIGNNSGTKLQQQGQKQLSSSKAFVVPKEEKTTHSSSLTLPIAVAGWPGGLPPLGYLPPLQTVVSMDGSSGSSSAVQPPHFPFSIPRPKRCATHHYIARNIYYHQQLTRMNHFWPAAAGSASLYGGAKPYNLNFIPPTENMILGKPLQGSFPGTSLNSKQGQVQGAPTVSGHTGKEKNSEATNFMDAIQKKQFVIQQAPQPVPPGNLLHTPAFIIPLNQHQASSSNPSGPAKSATSSSKASFSSNSAAGAPLNSSSLPAVVSFNYPNLPANEAPYLAVLPNNGYPFPVPTHVGAPPPLRGGAQAQAMPCFNGTFYPSQMFHPSQFHPQQPISQPLVQQANHNASASSGSSSSNKHPQAQQLRGAQISGNNFLTTAAMQSQQLQKQHVPSAHQSRKRDAELCGENAHSAVEARASHIQKNVYGQNFAVPVPPVNFSLMPPATLGGGGNHSDKQPERQSLPHGLNGGVELIPSPAFAMSFASFNGSSNTDSGINFSAMAQNPVIFQSLPDMARHGYQVAPAAQMTQPKNYQISDVKTGGESNNAEDGRKSMPGKLSNVGQSFTFCKPGSTDLPISTLMGTTVFDGSSRTLNFVSSPANLNRASRSMTAPLAANGQSQQQQLIQLQKRPAIGSGRTKVPTSNNQSSSSVAIKFPNNHSVFPKGLVQSNSSSQSSLWKNSVRTPASQVPAPSLAASPTSTIKNLPQQQGRAPQGQTQISFGGSPRSATAPSPSVAGSPTNSSISNSNGGSLRTTTQLSSKPGPPIPTLQPQPGENSSSSPSQKSSPVCGRNVPSILSTCPSHLSEVKY